MSKYYKAEDVIRKRAKSLADISYWEYGNPKNVDEWIEVAEMEFIDLPTIDIVHCKDCERKYVTGNTTQYYVCDFMDAQYDENGYCHHGERIDN